MIQMRWVEPGRDNSRTPKGTIPNPLNSFMDQQCILQYRDVVERNKDGEVVLATGWQTVEIEEGDK